MSDEADTDATRHIADFFSQYPEFDYSPTAPVCAEFTRLVKHYRWSKRSRHKKEAWSQFCVALEQQFTSYYGSDVHDINVWQALCVEVGVDPVPDTISKCKRVRIISHTHTHTRTSSSSLLLLLLLLYEFSPLMHVQVIESTHVNLVDFIDTRRTGEPVRVFSSYNQLKTYTIEEEKFFPRKSAKENGVLKYMLRLWVWTAWVTGVGSNGLSGVLSETRQCMLHPSPPIAHAKIAGFFVSQATHIAAFFERYPEFSYNPQTAVSAEFNRLVKFYEWERDSEEREEAWEGFGKAMGMQFADYYGSDVDDINAWQALCIALRVDPVPDTASECKQIVKSTHVNLVDFINNRVTGEPVRIFKRVENLRTYTKNEKKYFPKEAAKESGVLAYLLRNIFEV
ncbi:hypothetical protein AX15_004623 [Amanita polypyramis BW_CC]|nr:hypothetical protein AX15_004623 [Amanita polypyramis BW_CC]